MNTASQDQIPGFTDSGTKSVWTARILTGLAIAFFIMDGVMKLIQPQVVIDATSEIGWPADARTLALLGIMLLACTSLYAFPKTCSSRCNSLNGLSRRRGCSACPPR